MVLLHFCLRGGDGTTSLLSEGGDGTSSPLSCGKGWYYSIVVLGQG